MVTRRYVIATNRISPILKKVLKNTLTYRLAVNIILNNVLRSKS